MHHQAQFFFCRLFVISLEAVELEFSPALSCCPSASVGPLRHHCLLMSCRMPDRPAGEQSWVVSFLGGGFGAFRDSLAASRPFQS